jgi:pimeloyl-ACP methyl ester carboxylesterase
MFSSDFSDAELKEKLGHINIPVLLVQSSADEYIPRDIDGAKLVHRLANAIGPQARAVVLDGAKHVPEGDHAEKHVDVVRAFIAGMQCSRSRDDSKE